MPVEVVLRACGATGDTLRYEWDAAGTRFVARLVYDGLSFDDLRAAHGRDAVDRLAFHIIAFDAVKFGCARPAVLDFGPLRRFVTDAFEAVWRRVLHHVSGERRYTHDVPQIEPPRIPRDDVRVSAPPAVVPGPVPALLFSGGGKDSLLSAKLLAQAEVGYASLAYTKSVYGPAGLQRELLARLLDHCEPYRRHAITIEDAFPGASAAFAEPFEGETPWSVFAALPLALARGYGHLAIGNEKSADRGNVRWARTGEEINHQWGKSYEAERVLAEYVREHVLPGCRYWSVLKPVRDTVIFHLLAEHAAAVPATHSCNRGKPWCRRCPKCAYVLLGLAAYLQGTAAELNADDAITAPENLPAFRQMVGSGEHTPFECIGEPDEVRLMFHLLFRRGRYPELEAALGACGAPARDVLDRLLEVDDTAHGIPADFAERILGALRAGADAARERIAAALGEYNGKVTAAPFPRAGDV